MRGSDDIELRRAWRVLLLAGLGSMIPAVNLSVMYVVYPELQREFTGVSAGELSWALNGYTIVSSATLVLGGVLSDRTGRRRAMLAGVALALVSAVLCGSATSVGMLIAGRVALAIGASLIVPASTALALREFPLERRAAAFGALSAFGGLSAAAGPTIGAFVIELFGWRGAFWINVPLAGAVLILGPFVFRESRDESVRRLPDPLGAVLLMSSLSLLILALVQSPAWTWGDARTVGCLVAGVVLGAALLVRSSRHPVPIFDLSLFRHRNFALMNAVSFVASIGWFAMFFALTQFLRSTWDMSLVEAGLLVSPVPFGAGVLGPIGGRLADRHGYRPMMIGGALAFCAGAIWCIVVIPDAPNLWAWLPGIVLIGIGTGGVFPSVQGGTVIGMPPERYGIAAGVNQTIQRIGSAVGNAVAVMVLASSGPARTFDVAWVIVFVAGALTLVAALGLRRHHVESALAT